MSEQQTLSEDEVRKRVLDTLRRLDRHHGDRWSWDGQFRVLCDACGLPKLREEPHLRTAFRMQMHQLMPSGTYSIGLAELLIDRIVAVIRKVHAVGWAADTSGTRTTNG